MKTVFLSLFLLTFAAASSASAQVARRPFLFKDARGELAQARARGEADVLLVIASMSDRNSQVAAAISQAGGQVQFRSDEVDYLRARVPLDEVDALVSHPAVHSVDLSINGRQRTLGLPAEEGPGLPASDVDIGDALGTAVLPFVSNLAGVASADTIWPPKLTDYPLTNRYSPLGDLRALDFLADNPTYDGRGVTIAMIDMSADMLLPELQQAMTLEGETVPKIVQYETALDIEEDDDGRWMRMDDMVEATGGRLVYADSTYEAPRDGTFRMALFDELKNDSLSNSGHEGDVNRDGNPEGASHLFGVLWSEESGDVWVDTDQDLSFADETALSDYGARPIFGVFGTDDPATPVRESIGFGVQIDRDKKLVGLNLGVASHASLVVGAAVGSRGENGRFDGVAPGARLANVAEGLDAYGQIEATIIAAQNPDVDVIYFEQGSGITRNYLLRDGRLVASVIYDRLVERYGPSILSPTHNYPVLGAPDDIVMGRGIIGIGGHESKDNFFVNHGVRVEHDDNLLITGGYGPMGDGSLKPDVISPSNYVSTAQGFVDGRAIPGLFQLPPGYTIAGGTSTATPTAAGSVALLISAARQAGVRVDAHRLKYAVTRSARWVPHIAAYKQGNGVFNVAGAWDILKELDAGALMVDIESRAPVRTPYSHLLPTPHEGVGIYERSGWEVGDREQRIITLTRTSGPTEAMTFEVSWAGNDHATFSAPLEVTLPLGSAVELPVTVTPTEFGVHTAHLTLDHPSVAGYAFRTLATVVAPEPLNAENGFSVERSVEVPRPGMQSFFYNVPEGTSAVKFDLTWEDREVTLAVARPDTRNQRGERIPSSGSSATQVVSNPMPGTWEVRLSDIADTRMFDWEQAKKDEPVPPTPAKLTVTAMSADVSLASASAAVSENGDGNGNGSGSLAGWGVDNGSAYDASTRQVWMTNRMATFTGGVVSTPVGSARRERRTIGQNEQQMLEVEVLPGTAALVVGASGMSDPGADLDVYVFDCSGEECVGARADADPRGDESVVIRNPAAGFWKIVVDGSSVPEGETSYDYLDVVFNPAFGMLSVTDIPQERANGARWTATAHRWFAPAAHAEGRVPYVGAWLSGMEGDSPFLVGLGPLEIEGAAGPVAELPRQQR